MSHTGMGLISKKNRVLTGFRPNSEIIEIFLKFENFSDNFIKR